MEALEKSPLGNNWSVWLFQLGDAADRLMVVHLKLWAEVPTPLVAQKPPASHREAPQAVSVLPCPAS